jgi:hypothetical protein
MKQIHLLSSAGKFSCWLSCWTAILSLVACDGSSGGANDPNQTKPALVKAESGRLVDIYSYQRIDPARADRRDRFNRKHVLIARDVVVNSAIETQALIDAAGAEIVDASYEFLPFDKVVGHPELLILWDSTQASERVNFESARANAESGLAELAPSYRGQNTSTRPIPIMPRDAAIRLKFSGNLGVDKSFFDVNPAAVQLLEFKADPATTNAVEAFRAVPFRLIVGADTLTLDTTILGGENQVGFSSTGLPASVDNITANIRIAIPSRGGASSLFYVREDAVPELNGTDSFGRSSVIRDFRSGNPADGSFASLRDPETPMIAGSLGMGITAVDAASGRIRLHKRGHQVPVRGRFPFAEGTLNAQDIPGGSAAVPTRVALRGGDILTQIVDVVIPPTPPATVPTTERVRVRAEILQNQEVGTYRDDPAFPGAGRAADGSQGEALTEIWIRVASLEGGVDSLGRPVAFAPGSSAEGADCVVRAYYYEDVRFLDGSGSVSDATRRFEYLRIDPKPPATIGGIPVPPGTRISPVASISAEFTKPIDFDRLDNTTNFVISSNVLNGASFAGLVTDPKTMTAGVVPTRLTDQFGDGTVLQLQPPYGLFHQQLQTETYWVHVLLGVNGVTDLAGNALSIYDDPATPVSNWSVSFTLDQDLSNNLSGWHVYRFEDVDEDGTLPGSVDIFGQYRLLAGRLVAAETVRFSRTADNQNLGGINRVIRGECWDATANRIAPWPNAPPYPPNPGNYINGRLYQQPQQIDTLLDPNSLPFPYNAEGGVPQPIGRVLEPHQPRGSRMMMRYLEDDFSLDYKLPTEFLLDVEQLYWSPYSDGVVQYDVFDRYTMSLAHAGRRTDLKFFMAQVTPPPPAAPFLQCDLDCASISSSLSGTFAENVLGGSTATTVFEDKVYRINPNEAFRSPFDVKYVPYPRFDRTYTWRDSRLVNLDETGQLLGLGGARQPQASAPNDDVTADIDSPWIRDVPDAEFTAAGGVRWVVDEADFRGLRRRDHDPIALPLLVDFKVFPDGSANGVARGINTFQVAMVGMPSGFSGFPPSPGGYYNGVGVGCANRVPWPWVRIHSTGGVDPNTGQDILVDPANELVARGGYVKDAGAVVLSGGTTSSRNLGLFQAPPGDGMLNWAQADFVRKVSTMTFGFVDTVQPNRRQVIAGSAVNNDPGVPDFVPLQAVLGNLRISDFATLMDPPISRQPAGTKVVLEVRGAADFANSGTLYNPTYATGVTPSDVYNTRGNLLNPNYACEAFRYDQANSGAGFDTPRVDATGLTRYVTNERIGDIRDPATGLLPRFLNLRVVMENNVSQTPAVSPSLRSLSIVYRMAPSGN